MHTRSRIAVSIEAIRCQLGDCLRGIVVGKCRDEANLNDLADAARLLEALPMGSSEFAVASNRLSNARRYLDSGERGAAHYEIQLLMRSMPRS